MADRTAQSVQQVTRGWTVQSLDPGGGNIFETYPDRLQGPSSFLYNWNQVSFPGANQLGYGTDHPPPSSTGFEYL